MSELMVLGFEDEAAADAFGLELGEMSKDMIVQLQDAAEVVRDPDGKPHASTTPIWWARAPWAAPSGACSLACCSSCPSSASP